MVPPLCALEFFFMRGMLVCFAGVLHCLEDILQLVLRLPTTERSVMLCCYNSLTIGKVPCEQIFLSYMAFSSGEGGALGYFLGGYVPPGTPDWHPVLKKNSPKIDTPF